MLARFACAFALSSLLAGEMFAQGVCVGTPPTRLEKGPYRTRGFELTSEEMDTWLLQIRTMCQAQPWTVARGGTGRSSLTAYAPLFGGTTSTGAVQSGTVGTAGQVLTSNGAGALPTFQPAAGASPAGSGSELQYRASGTTLGAVTGSSVSGGSVTLKGDLDVDSDADLSTELHVDPSNLNLSIGNVVGMTMSTDELRFTGVDSALNLLDGNVTLRANGSPAETRLLAGSAELLLTDLNVLTFNGVDVVTTLTDDDVPGAGDFGALALTGDVTSSGLATTIAANSVALTTDTTGNYAAGDAEAGNATGVACTTCVDASDIASDAVTEPKLKAVDAAVDEECLTYETTTGDFEWQSCGASPAGSGSELQYRSSATAFGALTSSSVSGANLTLGGTLNMPASGSLFLGTSSNDVLIKAAGAAAILSIRKGDDSAYGILNAERFRAWAGGGGAPYGLMQADIGVTLASPYLFGWTSSGTDATGSADTKLERAAAGVVKLSDALRLNPRSSPPVTCGSANTKGVLYYDSDSDEVCACSGSAWVGLVAAGACS